MKQKLLLLITIVIVNINDLSAQLLSGNVWYVNHETSDLLSPSTISFGTYSDSESNPDVTGINDQATVSSFVKSDGNHSQIKFDLSEDPITDYTTTIIKVQVYLDVPTATVGTITNCNLRVGLRNNALGLQNIISKDVTVGEEWVEYTYDFTGVTAAHSSMDELIIYFAAPDTDDDAIGFTYYIDALQGPDLNVLSSESIAENNSNLRVVPNPVSNNFQLTESENVESIQIYNINGALIKTFNVSSSYDISDLADGVYFAKINTYTNSKTVKIIKS